MWHTQTHSLSLPLTNSHLHTHTHTHTQCNTHTLSLPPSLTHTLTHTHTHTHTHSHKHTHNHTNTHLHKHIHTLTHTRYLTWKPTSCTSWARITWDRPLRSRKAKRALQLKKWAVPRRVLNVNPWCSFMSFITSGVTRSRLKGQKSWKTVSWRNGPCHGGCCTWTHGAPSSPQGSPGPGWKVKRVEKLDTFLSHLGTFLQEMWKKDLGENEVECTRRAEIRKGEIAGSRWSIHNHIHSRIKRENPRQLQVPNKRGL